MLCFFQCASTNRNIVTLSSIWPVKSTCFFRLECPNWGSFRRNYVLPYGICGQIHIYYLYWVYSWSPEKSEKTKSHSLERTYSVNIFYLIGKIAVFFQCASTNRNILTLSSIWPVKSTCFFRLECPNRGSFWRNSGLSSAICGQNAIWTCIFLILYTAGAPKNKKNQVP